MKFLLLFVLILPAFLDAQTTADLAAFQQKQTSISRAGMYTLGGWAVANIGTGLVLRGQFAGSTKYFHEMNAIWNVFNLGIAGMGVLGTYRKHETWSLFDTYKRQQQLEKTFMINGALDLTYITTGFLLVEIGQNNVKNHDRLDGYGKSLVLQGGFLLLFDSFMFLSHHHHGKQLNPWLKKLELGATSNGLGLTYKC